MSYPGSVILVPTHTSNSGQNIVPALRRSAVSVRDVSRSPRPAASSPNPDEMEFSEASVMGKRLSASTNHLGTGKAQKLSKGMSQTTDSMHVFITVCKSTKNALQQSLIVYHLTLWMCNVITI